MARVRLHSTYCHGLFSPNFTYDNRPGHVVKLSFSSIIALGCEPMAIVLNWESVDSSNVDKVAYDENSQTLAVRFRSGSLYTYHEVEKEIYHQMVGAESVGQYLNRVVKPMFNYNKWSDEKELLDFLL
jgi:hypothetical protein